MKRVLQKTGGMIVLALFLVVPGTAWASAAGNPGYFRAVVETLASPGERRPGSPGAREAARFIQGEFERLGFETRGSHRFSLPAITGKGAAITLAATGETHGINPFLGNVISPPTISPPGLEADLVYVGDGGLEAFNNKNIADACVLMDLDSGGNWLNALALGAKALIYLSPEETDRFLYEDKMELSPVRFPRFAMDRSRAEKLFGNLESLGTERKGVTVRLTSDLSWNRVQGENLYCLVPGTSLDPELIVVESFYDTSAFVAGRAPGADQACSMATLLELARYLRDHPPRRSVLLMATSGHGSSLAGLGEILWSLRVKQKSLDAMMARLDGEIEASGRSLSALAGFRAMEAPGANGFSTILDHVTEDIKARVEELNSRLMQLRLAGMDPEGLIPSLARERMMLKQLSWKTGAHFFSPREKELVAALVPGAVTRLERRLADARTRKQNLDSSLALRHVLADRKIRLFISLHLSSHGNGVGAFNRGGLYPIKEKINPYPPYAKVDRVLAEAAKTLDRRLNMPGFFKDTLRPSFQRSWDSLLFDTPALGGEVSQLAGFLGISLVTLSDARPLWGTPRDRAALVDFSNAGAQSRYLTELIAHVAAAPKLATGRKPRNGFATIKGRANFLRSGELFADAPAAQTMILSFQGPGIRYAMADETGLFYIKGVADKKHVLHKVILEGYRFDPETGRVVWAVDKKRTSKAGYRVKVKRLTNETDLVIFPCRQTTLVNLLEPRTFEYMTKIQVLDGVFDAPPIRYWFSRIDTRASTLCSLFLAPGSTLKLTLSDTLLTKKLILTNAGPAHPRGRGYAMEEHSLIAPTRYLAARDMWALLNPRIANLEEKGINNQKIRDLRTRGNFALDEAARLRGAGLYDGFFRAAGTALALAGRVYHHVEAVQKDVLFGVLFYIALFVPFAFCLERFLFCFTNIYKRIIAFLSILFLLIAVIYKVHPAFELAYSPLVVILAFFILSLSALVAWIIFLRFEEEVKGGGQSPGEGTEIGLFKAFSASFFMGVANLRRRRMRTVLTCTTLVILTFTVMSFTSVRNIRRHTRMAFDDHAPYQGMLIKKLNWKSLPESGVKTLGNALDAPAVTAPRAWLEARDRTRALAVPIRFGTNSAEGHGLLGLSPLEPRVSGLGRRGVRGKWFTGNDRYTAMISETMARQLNLDASNVGSAVIQLWSLPFRVVAVFDEKTFDDFRDLDGEPLTPVTFPDEVFQQTTQAEMDAMESGQDVKAFQSRYRHLGFDRTVIIPHRTLVSMGGRSMSVAIRPGGDIMTLGKELVDRFGLWLFSGEKDGVYLYSASDTLDYSGIPNILVPILISVFIVLNTMIGSVYERKPEIGIYTSVGMAPLHVSILFIAEALSYAVLSVVLGYIFAQVFATVFAGTWVLSGITVNYSSLAGVAAMAMVMGVVIISAIYPSRVAAKIAIPDVEKSWRFSISTGDHMGIDLPFLMKRGEEESAAGYLFDYIFAHREISHDVFTADDLVVNDPMEQEEGAPMPVFSIDFRAWVAPFDLGLMQDVTLTFRESDIHPGYVAIKMEITRRAGEHNAWWRANQRFVNRIRKQLMIWRSLDGEQKKVWIGFFCFIANRRIKNV
ncbi:MAG: peptide ABC transporter permease [Desulfobacteraceae bacterium]|nr:peptide ABC transporter permease [Desulfobacteraceae bacterium]